MDRDQRKLVNHLFAEATGLCEDAHIIAVSGQSPKLTLPARRRRATQLRIMACRIRALADAVIALTGHDWQP